VELAPRVSEGRVGRIGPPVETRDLVCERFHVEGLELRGGVGEIAAGGLLSDPELGQLRAEPLDVGFAPTRAAACENRQRGQHAEAPAHPFSTVARGRKRSQKSQRDRGSSERSTMTSTGSPAAMVVSGATIASPSASTIERKIAA